MCVHLHNHFTYTHHTTSSAHALQHTTHVCMYACLHLWLIRAHSYTETGEYHESFNYAVAETVEPGSTFKLASLMAAMDDGNVELEELVDTGIGVKYFSGEDMHDSNEKEGGNGIITAEQVFEKS